MMCGKLWLCGEKIMPRINWRHPMTHLQSASVITASLIIIAIASVLPASAEAPDPDPDATWGRAVAAILRAITDNIIKNENAGREKFTTTFVDEASREYPDYNVVIIHPDHDVSGEFTHQHRELNMDLIGIRTVGYDIYFARKTRAFSLTNKGDGGFINWAFSGDFIREGKDGKTITAFYSIPPGTLNTEVVYLSNCESSQGKSSEMNYYRYVADSKNGQQPEATAVVAHGQTVTWEGQPIVGEFPDKNRFTSNITDHNGPLLSVKGSGSNIYHGFTCYQDNYRALYRDGDKTCNSVYFCVP
jgi:hypothetical protein